MLTLAPERHIYIYIYILYGYSIADSIDLYNDRRDQSSPISTEVKENM